MNNRNPFQKPYIGLLDNPTVGSYKLQDREVAGLNEDERADLRKGTIGFVFLIDSKSLLPSYSLH